MTSTGYPVSVLTSAPRTIAAVHAHLPIDLVPQKCIQYLDQVYAAARTGALQLDGQNVFVYFDAPEMPGDVHCAFGAGITSPFVIVGNVQPTSLPIGEAATATHWGDYGGLRGAHHAVIAWCKANGRRRAGPRWEVYGHWSDDITKVRTDVFHLLEPVG